jgi:hypothetical protein
LGALDLGATIPVQIGPKFEVLNLMLSVGVCQITQIFVKGGKVMPVVLECKKKTNQLTNSYPKDPSEKATELQYRSVF